MHSLMFSFVVFALEGALVITINNYLAAVNIYLQTLLVAVFIFLINYWQIEIITYQISIGYRHIECLSMVLSCSQIGNSEDSFLAIKFVSERKERSMDAEEGSVHFNCFVHYPSFTEEGVEVQTMARGDDGIGLQPSTRLSSLAANVLSEMFQKQEIDGKVIMKADNAKGNLLRFFVKCLHGGMKKLFQANILIERGRSL